MIIPGSSEYQTYLKSIETLVSQIGEVPWLPSDLTKALPIMLRSFPRCLYQLQQEFEADNPQAEKDLTKLIKWAASKGYLPFNDSTDKTTDLIWSVCIGLVSLNKLSDQIEDQCNSAGINLPSVVQETVSKLAKKGKILESWMTDDA